MDWREAGLGGNVLPGWVPLVDELHNRLLEIAPDIRVDQVKEKFGRLRYYYNLGAETAASEVDTDAWLPEQTREVVHRLVEEAATASGWMCEVCGAVGRATSGQNGWVKTLCPEHRARYEEEGTPAWMMVADPP